MKFKLRGADTEECLHLVVEEAHAGLVGLYPFAVDDELGDSALAGVGNNEVGCAGSRLDVDFFEGEIVGGQEALCLSAIAAPGG